MPDTIIQYNIPAKFLPARIISIKQGLDNAQSEGDWLIEFEYTEQVEGFIDEGQTSTHARRSEIRASKDGTVEKVYVSKGQVIDDPEYATVVLVKKTYYRGVIVVPPFIMITIGFFLCFVTNAFINFSPYHFLLN